VADYRKIGAEIRDAMAPEWEKMEHTTTVYVPMSDFERKQKDRDSRLPLATVVPFSLASLDTYRAYLSNAFLRNTLHRYKGKGGPQAHAKALFRERVIAVMSRQFKEHLHLMTAWRDALTYGYGGVMINWEKKRVLQPMTKEVDEMLHEFIKMSGLPRAEVGDIIKMAEERIIAEGGELQPLDVWNTFLDPRCTINQVQKSRFFGYMHEANAYDMLTNETDPEYRTFNGKFVHLLAEQGVGAHIDYKRSCARNTRVGLGGIGSPNKKDAGAIDLVHSSRFFIKLIPKHWGLSDDERPQWYQVETVADMVVTQCNPLGLYHGMIPVALFAPNTTGHDIIPVSNIATTYGIQQNMDWIIRARAHNVMASMHNMWLYDPSKIFVADLMKPGPNKFIRLRPGAYNPSGNLDAFIKQLPVSDVTANHYSDLFSLMQLGKEANGTEDIVRGNMANMPERPGAAGMQNAFQAAISRIQNMTMMMGLQGMQDIAFIHGHNLTQFMETPQWINTIGERGEQAIKDTYGIQGELRIDPGDLDEDWEVIPHDARLQENDNFQQKTQVMQILLGIEGVGQQLAAQYDMGRIFSYWAEEGGFKDIHEFRASGQQLQGAPVGFGAPDEQVMQQQQAGNIIPLDQAQEALAA
jgi:hypothetical protein